MVEYYKLNKSVRVEVIESEELTKPADDLDKRLQGVRHLKDFRVRDDDGRIYNVFLAGPILHIRGMPLFLELTDTWLETRPDTLRGNNKTLATHRIRSITYDPLERKLLTHSLGIGEAIYFGSPDNVLRN